MAAYLSQVHHYPSQLYLETNIDDIFVVYWLNYVTRKQDKFVNGQSTYQSVRRHGHDETEADVCANYDIDQH